jgi:TolB-like protein
MLMNAPVTGAVAVLEPAAQALLKSLARGPAEIPAAEVRAALARTLAGAAFVRARRTSRLLQFLVEKRLANAVRDINEYTIGIEVFERDPATYSPGQDPVVRVQVGRLREKLKLYYATPGPRPDIAFSIPIGSYMPIIQRNHTGVEHFEPSHLLAIMPLACMANDAACAAFTQGLGEELTYHLFQEFGSKLVAPAFPAAGARRKTDAADAELQRSASHLIEGGVRLDGELIRVSIRLVDTAAGSIAWSQQFDRRRPFAIALQEELAFFICAELKHYFCLD